MPDYAAAKRSLSAFAQMVGRPMAAFQAKSLELQKQVTVIVAPRQSGKSWSLALLGLHRAFVTPGLRVLIVSAGDEASKRLLADVRAVAAASPLLAGSIVNELSGLITLSNRSEIRSVPASERQVRGWSVDLLLVDEAALVNDDLLLGAAIPTTAARKGSKIVLASSATSASGAYYDFAEAGRGHSEHVETHLWALTDCPWISPSVIAAAKESMTALRFAAEFEGRFASAADALFPRSLLDRATADYDMPGLGGSKGLLGCDWGATTDRSAAVGIGRFAAPEGIFGVVAAHAWRSGEALDGPGGIVGQIADLPPYDQYSLEVNGLGYPVAQSLSRRLLQRRRRSPAIEFITTTQASKSATYSSIRMWLEQGRLVLPASAPELLRELLLLRVQLTQSGGEKIEAGVGHDDLADALYLACGPYQDGGGEWHSRLGNSIEETAASHPDAVPAFAEGETVKTGSGIVIPRTPKIVVMRGERYGPPSIISDHPWGGSRLPKRSKSWDQTRWRIPPDTEDWFAGLTISNPPKEPAA